MDRYLKETRLLNFSHRSLMELVKSRVWVALPEYERIGHIYDFVQNEIAFGYNEADAKSARLILALDGEEKLNDTSFCCPAWFNILLCCLASRAISENYFSWNFL